MRHEYADDGSFSFYVNRSLPPRVWSSILTNGSFGYIAADSGMGNMWLKNARELRLTPWINDPMAIDGAEVLEYCDAAGRHSLFADDDGAPLPRHLRLRLCRLGKKLRQLCIALHGFCSAGYGCKSNDN